MAKSTDKQSTEIKPKSTRRKETDPDWLDMPSFDSLLADLSGLPTEGCCRENSRMYSFQQLSY